ncbi:acetyl-CoA carboxylase biotin carboxyl carrier protein [Bacillus songklensis]|uniref:Biotin carboxyl carrier protein of acetyl-CoA carboxylase n=1 Tax=Bacillus songklensis TaxID=1069116 RepID=A0ABV8AY14_9BACI
MLKIQEIRELIKLVDCSTIEEFVYEKDGTKVKMKKKGALVTNQVVAVPAAEQVVQAASQAGQPAPVINQPAPKQETPSALETDEKKENKVEADESLHKITSPMVGTFYASPSPDAPPYVTAGDKVKKDSVVCIVEAMKLFNEIEAEVNGEIVEVLVQSGQLVEYGQPLFLVKAE